MMNIYVSAENKFNIIYNYFNLDLLVFYRHLSGLGTPSLKPGCLVNADCSDH